MTPETALTRTIEATLARRIAQLEDAPSPAAGVLKLLEGVIVENPLQARRAERTISGPVRGGARKIADRYTASNHELRRHLREVFLLGQACGEFDTTLDPEDACDLLLAVMEGMEISAQGGASVQASRSTARYAVRRLSTRSTASRWAPPLPGEGTAPR